MERKNEEFSAGYRWSRSAGRHGRPRIRRGYGCQGTATRPASGPIYNWTGFYIGGNGGWGQSRNCWDFLDAAGVAFAAGCRERSGGLVGGQIGYRWQASQWVFGLEAQGDWADLSNSASA